MKNTLVIIFIFLLFISCQKNNNSRVEHPTEANLLTDEEASFVIKKDSSSGINNSQLMQLASEIGESELIKELGETASEGENLLGNIVDASFNDNYIYLLDSQKMNVSIYNTSGEYVSSVARRGRGPGELVSPESIIAHKNYLFILNNHYGVQVYKKEPDENEYEPYNQLSSKIIPDDLCLNGNSLVVNSLSEAGEPISLRNDQNIYVFELNNLEDAIQTFGNLYVDQSRIAKLFMSMGGIECAPNSKTIIQYFGNIGQLTGYNLEGEIIWKSKISDFNHLKQFERGSIFGPDPKNLQNNYDVIENLVFINDHYFIFQIVNRERVEDKYKKLIKSYLADFNTGEGIYMSSDLAKVLGVDFENKLFVTYDENKPTVSLYKF